MKKTLLAITQEILNDIDSDEVNSIDDTPEATQVANIVQSTYNSIISNRNWPHTARLVNLTSSADSTKPNIMYIEDDVKEMISVYYNKSKFGETRLRFEPVRWIEPDEMLRVFYGRNTDAENVEKIILPTGEVCVITNNYPPKYYTSFDDKTVVFDSYDSEVDSILQSSKTQMRAYVIPSFSLTNDFIPDLPDEAFSFLIEESKSKSAIKIAQKVDQKAEQESKRQNQWLSRKAWRVAGGIKYVRFGRTRNGYAKDPTFRQDSFDAS